MARKMTRWLALGLFLIAAVASAQTPPGRQAGARERLRQNLYHLRLLRMTEALDLTEAQTSKIYPVAARVEKEKAEIIRRLGTEMQELRDLVARPDAPDEDLAARVKTIRELRLGLQQKDREFEDFLEANLSALQIAKYVLFQADFNRTIGEKLNRARALMRSRGRF
jgi:Spy/CpxP family protein refolding chaperone